MHEAAYPGNPIPGSQSLLSTADISTVSEGALHAAGARQLPYGGGDVDQLLRRMLGNRGVEGLDDAALHRLKDSGARLASEAPADHVVGTLHGAPLRHIADAVS